MRRRHMNKLVSLLLIVAGLFGGLFMLILKTGRDDMVETAFRQIIEDMAEIRGRNPDTVSRDWAWAYRIDGLAVEAIMGRDFASHGYVGWQPFRRRKSCSPSPSSEHGGPLDVDGFRHRVMWNRTADSDDYDMEAMFVDVDEKVLVLYYGRTYGM